MKILKLIIENYQQFKHLELDFTHPQTGEPLDKICFIGRNATGKSTILWILSHFLNNTYDFFENGSFTFEFLMNKNKYIFNHSPLNLEFSSNTNEIYNLKLKNNFNDSVIYCPPESHINNYFFENIPETNVKEALSLFTERNFFNIVSNETVSDFWKTIVFNIKHREDLFNNFANENENKSFKQLKEEFNNQQPDILKEIEKLWSKILKISNLYFDAENAKKPIQLTDNLEVYIKTKINNEIVPYKFLSTGIRNFIFKIGHIYSLYFNRKIERGFLLIDEPENSLFPDFLYDLIDDVYCKIIENQNTQFFVSTHNPIIAAQFEPYERFILDFDDDGYVIAKKGTVPVGDDPNDILFKDFGMRSIYTKKGIAKWERYLELKILIKQTTDETERNKLVEEFSKLGREYNFPSK